MRPYVTKIGGFHTQNKLERNFADMGVEIVSLMSIGGQAFGDRDPNGMSQILISVTLSKLF